MVQRVNIVLEDDIDGSQASETVSFALDGTSYEIDLNEKNAKDLRSAFSAYVTNGRRTANRARRRDRGAGGSTSGHTTREIRDWARSNGYDDVPDRGRIPGEIREAFEAAH